jgi:hypothetical protein
MRAGNWTLKLKYQRIIECLRCTHTTEGVTLEQGVWQGPATINSMVEIADVGSALRSSADPCMEETMHRGSLMISQNSYVNFPLGVPDMGPRQHIHRFDQNIRFRSKTYRLKK